jgi:hypothetical protein
MLFSFYFPHSYGPLLTDIDVMYGQLRSIIAMSDQEVKRMVEVPLASQNVLTVSKGDSQVLKTGLIILISVLVTSAIFMGAILGVAHRAQPTIQEAKYVLKQAQTVSIHSFMLIFFPFHTNMIY